MLNTYSKLSLHITCNTYNLIWGKKDGILLHYLGIFSISSNQWKRPTWPRNNYRRLVFFFRFHNFLFTQLPLHQLTFRSSLVNASWRHNSELFTRSEIEIRSKSIFVDIKTRGGLNRVSRPSYEVTFISTPFRHILFSLKPQQKLTTTVYSRATIVLWINIAC